MPAFPTHLVIPVFLILVGLEIWHERSGGRETYTFRGALANLSAGMVEYAIGVGSHVLVIVAYAWQFEQFAVMSWSASIPGILLAFLLYELCYYWKHRLGHEVNFMWAGHVVHHQSEEMNLTTGARLSATSPLYDILFYLPMAVLGISPAVYIGCKTVSLVYQFFLHTEHVRQLPAWVEYVLNTPSHHRVHHSSHAAHLDRNYGSFIILWDRLFGTFADERIAPVYGTTEPLDRWNPVYANVRHYGQLLNRLRKSKSFRDAAIVFFGKPDDVPGYLLEPAASPQKKVYTPLSPALKAYVFLQFMGAVVVVFSLIRLGGILPLPVILLGVGWVLWSAAQVGTIMDREMDTILKTEALRHLCSIVLIWGVCFATGLISLLLTGLITVVLLASFGWVTWVYLRSMRLMV